MLYATIGINYTNGNPLDYKGVSVTQDGLTEVFNTGDPVKDMQQAREFAAVILSVDGISYADSAVYFIKAMPYRFKGLDGIELHFPGSKELITWANFFQRYAELVAPFANYRLLFSAFDSTPMLYREGVYELGFNKVGNYPNLIQAYRQVKIMAGNAAWYEFFDADHYVGIDKQSHDY